MNGGGATAGILQQLLHSCAICEISVSSALFSKSEILEMKRFTSRLTCWLVNTHQTVAWWHLLSRIMDKIVKTGKFKGEKLPSENFDLQDKTIVFLLCSEPKLYSKSILLSKTLFAQ